MMRTTNKFQGFTIVELLIVIVVIAILASITIVSYNGVQNRAKNTAAASVAKNVSTKAELANTFNGAYPSTIANFNANTESQIQNSGLILGTPTAATGTNTVSYEYCSAGTALGGARIRAWDYSTGALSATYTYLGAASGGAACTTWVAVTGS